MKKNNKKTSEFLKIAIVVVIAIAAFIGFNIIKNSNDDTTLKQITYKQYQTMIADGESFFFEVAASSCGACESFTPKLEQALEKTNTTAYSIDLDKLSTDDRNKLTQDLSITGTPTTLYIENGISKYAGLIGDNTLEDTIKFIEIHK